MMELRLNSLLEYSNTPLLHYSITPFRFLLPPRCFEKRAQLSRQSVGFLFGDIMTTGKR